MNDKKIAIFDSGVGGLTVLKEINRVLPNEDIIYFGDTKRVPYGPREKSEIVEFSLQIVDFLMESNIKIIIIACNTITSIAIEEIKKKVNIPVIGVIEPGINMALNKTRNNKIGLIGTETTINSGVYQKGIEERLINSEVKGVSCPKLVEIVEKGIEEVGEKRTSEVIKNYLNNFEEFDLDTLVLACTHFPVIRNLIKSNIENINIVDPAYETADKVKFTLEKNNLLNSRSEVGELEYYITENRDKFKSIGEQIIGVQMENLFEIKLD